MLWPFPGQLPADADVIFFLVGPKLRSAGHWCAADSEATLIAVRLRTPPALKVLTDTQAHGVITKPYHSTSVLSTLVLACASSGYRRLHGKIAKLEEAIKARRHIEKAVRILMDSQRLGESEAYSTCARVSSTRLRSDRSRRKSMQRKRILMRLR